MALQLTTEHTICHRSTDDTALLVHDRTGALAVVLTEGSAAALQRQHQDTVAARKRVQRRAGWGAAALGAAAVASSLGVWHYALTGPPSQGVFGWSGDATLSALIVLTFALAALGGRLWQVATSTKHHDVGTGSAVRVELPGSGPGQGILGREAGVATVDRVTPKLRDDLLAAARRQHGEEVITAAFKEIFTQERQHLEREAARQVDHHRRQMDRHQQWVAGEAQKITRAAGLPRHD